MAEYDMTSVQNDATAYGGRNTGFDPAYADVVGSDATYNPSVDDFSFDDYMPYDLSSMFSQGSSSTGVYGNPAAPNTTPFNQTMSGINDFFNRNPFGRIAGTVMNFTPVGRAINTARGIGTMLGQGNMMGAGATALGAFGGLPGAAINAGYQASRGNMSNAFGLAGGMVAGQPGAMVGSQLGRAVSGRGGPSVPGTVGMGEGGGGFNLEGAAQGLGSLWAASQADKGLSAAQGSNDALQSQMSSLAGMYSPNSPYAQQLRQTLERKDAAAGRRSQYGPREVQLMAALADKQAGVSDSMARLGQTSQANQIALNNQRNQTRGQQLALLTNLGRQSGLFNMFSGGGGGSAPAPYYKDVADDTTWMGEA